MHSYGFGNSINPGEMKEHAERARQAMQEYQERIQDWARRGHKGPTPTMPRSDQGNPSKRDGGKAEHRDSADHASDSQSSSHSETHTDSHSSVNIVRRDGSGEYSLRREDGKSTFIARPKDGKEQSWPANTDEERAAIPAEFREKLRMFDNLPDHRPQQEFKRGDAPSKSSHSESEKARKSRPATT